jgi:nicotinic acetylcholine receptor
MTKAILHHDGKVVWTPPAIFKSSCEVNVEYFPFDEQTCFLKFGSWTFDGFQVDLIHKDAEVGNDTVPDGIDLSEYYLNFEWDILSVPAERHVKTYPCCPEPYPGMQRQITRSEALDSVLLHGKTMYTFA